MINTFQKEVINLLQHLQKRTGGKVSSLKGWVTEWNNGAQKIEVQHEH